MPLERRKKVLVWTILQLLVIAVFLPWGLVSSHQKGWTGISPFTMFDPEEDDGQLIYIFPGSPAQRAGLESGDQILSVDGIPVQETDRLRDLSTRIRRGDRLTFEAARGDGEEGETITATLEITSPWASLALMPPLITNILVAVVYFGISLLVLWARPRARSAFVFYLLCSGTAWLFLINLALTGILANPLCWVWLESLLAFFSVTAALGLSLFGLFVHFALVFPREQPILQRVPKTLWWVYSYPFLVILGFWTTILAGKTTKDQPELLWLELPLLAVAVGLGLRLRRLLREGTHVLAAPVTTQLLVLTLLTMLGPALRRLPHLELVYGGGFFVALLSVVVGYPALTCWIFIRSYRRSTAEEKLQLRWPLWGLVVGLGGSVVVTIVPTAVAFFRGLQFGSGGDASLDFVVTSIVAETFARLLYLLIPVAFAFGILKHRLMDINVLIRKTLVYAALTGFVLLGYFVLVGIVGLLLITYTGIESQAWTILSTLIIAALFVPVRNRLQGFVEERFGDRDSAEEIRQARAIQSSLLPQGEVDQLPGFEIAALWEPARTVSGDYFDVLRLPGNRLGLCIGDVSGKGMPAALLMSSLQAAVKAVAPTAAEPDEVCRQVRSVVTRNLSGGKFVTFFYAVLDASGRFTYSNAGHNPPILIRADGTMERLNTRGSAFARLFSGAEAERGSVELHSGDRLVLFTDGATEVFDYHGAELGEPGLSALVHRHRDLGAHDLRREVAHGVHHHADGELTDDLTLLVVSA